MTELISITPPAEPIQTRRELDLLNAPLTGHSLIEANAGTGKTFTISRLYLRFLLEKRLPVASILVVTFTEAATVELKERIHNLLREFRDVAELGSSEDPFFSGLLNRVNPTVATELLNDALHSFDNASIFTIHGFCRTLLTRHPFECQMPFKAEIITNQTELIEEVIADFWRATVDHYSPGFAGFLSLNEYNPLKLKKLWDGVSSTISEVSIIPDVPFLPVEQIESKWSSAFDSLKQLWNQSRDEIGKLLNSGALNATSYKPSTITALLEETNRSLNAPAQWAQLPEKFDRLTPSILEKYTKKNCTTPVHPFFSACQEASDVFQIRLETYKNNLLHFQKQFLTFVRKECSARKDVQSKLYFDDLLLKVESALKNHHNSNLINTLRKNYQAALIDEFQDTDQIQYFIFATIFANAPLYLIGDPKQSIYRFRGADIFTYLKASQDVNHTFTLSRNYRSHPDLVQSVNTLFCRSPHLFLFNQITAHPSDSGLTGEHCTLSINGATEPPLTWICFNSLKSDEIYTKIVDTVSGRIAYLVAKGSRNEAFIGSRPVSAKDIAILVRKNSEATILHKALIHKGIPAIIESGCSVFSTLESQEQLSILRAMVTPHRSDFIRSALITTMMGFNANDLDHLSTEPTEWDAITARFYAYHDLWEQHGIASVMRKFLTDENVRPRLLSQPAGERKLTNITHLVELLQNEEHSDRKGLHPLLDWFTQKTLQDSDHIPDEEVMRLESDADAVSIITVHRSKGLQFPIVFCPFIWDGISPGYKIDKPYIVHSSDTTKPLLVIGEPDSTNYFNAYETETLAEEMRLLYVALTRAESCCYAAIHYKPNSDAINAAAFLLLSDGTEQPPAAAFRANMKLRGDFDIYQLLTISFNNQNRVAFENADVKSYEAISSVFPPPKTLKIRTLERPLPEPWRITSFSSLSKTHNENDRINDDPGVTENAHTNDASQDDFSTMSKFPRGEIAGLFLHELLEKTDLSTLDEGRDITLIRELLSRYNFDSQWNSVIYELLKQIAATTLLPNGITLNSVKKSDCIKELQFHFQVENLNSKELQKLLSLEQPNLFSPAPYFADGVDFKQVSGYMKGFIDLIFTAGDKFYIIDWKSNYLGSSPDMYTFETMDIEMNAKHYKLQYYIYTVAVHRYLSLRCKGYSYATHFCGVYYLFLRGLQQGKTTGIYYDRPGVELIQNLNKVFS
jgi:exodeoxyribonuclease V beta subunit